MSPPSLLNQLGFVAKVIGLSVMIAIAFKTIAPRLPIPATATVSLIIVLAPAVITGAFLTWQLWTANHADPTHADRD